MEDFTSSSWMIYPLKTQRRLIETGGVELFQLLLTRLRQFAIAFTITSQ